MESIGDLNTIPVDPVGKEEYEKVLQKPLFDEHNPGPLVGVRALTINHLFAKVWTGLSEAVQGHPISIRERRLITIALLAAQGRSEQLEEHLTGAARAGITEGRLEEGELLDVMIQVAHYAGWPAGSGGQKIVQQVFRSERAG
jgi:alkylhydroperoxidase/carboxymuconolactone decarboxylase family protein YurZ